MGKIDNKFERGKNGKWSKPKIIRKSIKQEVANNLISNFSGQSFWKLDNTLLNTMKEEHEDGTVTKYSMSDGTNYRFEIISGNNFRIIEAYEPKYFQALMPNIKEREIFIRCNEKFEQIFKQ